MRVDLYEDEAGGLYIHSPYDAHAFAHVEREMSWLLDAFEGIYGLIASRSWYRPVAPEEWTLFEALATWDDAGIWTNFERVPIDQVIPHAALVASWIPDDERTEVYDASRPGSLPPGPNAQIMLRKHLPQWPDRCLAEAVIETVAGSGGLVPATSPLIGPEHCAYENGSPSVRRGVSWLELSYFLDARRSPP